MTLKSVIILSGDVEMPPGPTGPQPQAATAFPCSMCNAEVTDDDWALFKFNSNFFQIQIQFWFININIYNVQCSSPGTNNAMFT